MHRTASRWLAAALPALALSAGNAAAASSAGGQAGAYVTYAEVVEVTPRYGWTEVSEPVRHCQDVAVGGYRERRVHGYDDHRPYRHYHHRDRRPHEGGGNVAAGLVGGLIGGLVGNQFGGGSGRKALTVVGAVVGASIAQQHVRRSGDEARHQHDAGHQYDAGRHYDADAYRGRGQDARRRVIRRCSESVEHRQVRGVQGYDVTYRYQGRTFNKWMNEHPGDSVRIHVEVEPADEVAVR